MMILKNLMNSPGTVEIARYRGLRKFRKIKNTLGLMTFIKFLMTVCVKLHAFCVDLKYVV